MRKIFRVSAALALVFLIAGCASLQFQHGPVEFENPYEKLQIVPVQPTEEEAAGVELRFLAPKSGTARYGEEHKIYTSIKDGKGRSLRLSMDRREVYQHGNRPDSYLITSNTTFQDPKYNLFEELEQTERGEILRFVKGTHHSKMGSFQIMDWQRTPVLPEGPVKVGERWSWREEMKVEIDSILVSQISKEPYRMTCVSELEGFATVRGKRTAVIKTTAAQTKREEMRAFFKKIVADTNSSIEERAYLDYTTGQVLVRIAMVKTILAGINVPLIDEGKSQVVSCKIGGDSTR